MILKFCVNPLDGFRENNNSGRTTDDGRPRHDSSCAVELHKAELQTSGNSIVQVLAIGLFYNKK